MLFSVVIPVYNTEEYLKECIDSVLAQSFADFEVILVDDGSLDKSPQICDEYAKSDNRVRVIHKQNGGSTSARKIGIKECVGDYVFTVDSDDYIGKDCLLNISRVVLKYNPDVIKLNFRRFSNKSHIDYFNLYQDAFFEGDLMEKVKKTFIYDAEHGGINLGCCAFGTCLTVAKRELICSHQLPVPNDIKMGDDLAVVAPMLMNAASVYFLEGIYYFYRDTPGSIVNSFDPTSFKRLEVLVRYLLENIPKQYHNKISVYTLGMTFDVFSKAAKAYTKREFSDFLKKEFTDYLYNVGCGAKVSMPTLKDRFKIALYKCKMFGVLYLMWHRKG